MIQPTVAVDFDGVIADYRGWKGVFELGEPYPGAGEFLRILAEDYRVVVFTTRSVAHVMDWLFQRGWTKYVVDVTNQKPVAFAYIDDRAICFNGCYADALQALHGFEAHWEKQHEPG